MSHSPSQPTTSYHIRADRSAFDLLNLVVNPVKELIQFKELIRNIISRDLKVRYKRSFLGIIWTVLAPLMSMMVMWAVFTYAMKVQIPFYAAYLLTGIVAWNLFFQSSTAGCAAIINAAPLINKIKLPRVIFPVSAVINNLVNMGFAFIALLIVMLVSGAPFHATIFLAPLMILPMIVFCLGWSMLVSALAVFFRDLQYLLEISLGAFFYLTPILYQAESLPPKAMFIVSLNPIAKYIHLFRSVVYSGEVPELRTYLVAWGIAIASLLIGWIVFQRLQRRFIYWM